MTPPLNFKVVGTEADASLARRCRRMLVGPWCNQPEEYEGYHGFVGWAGATRLQSGRWLIAFSSGYWHASPPLTDDILREPSSRKLFDEWRRIGMPEINAPRGGRAEVMHSDDEGLTWSRPALLVDTEEDDRHPTILQLGNGALLATFFSYRLPGKARAQYILSSDGGTTWTAPQGLSDNAGGFGNGSAILLRDGSVAWAVELNAEPNGARTSIGLFRSDNNGRSFQLAGSMAADHDLNEPGLAELPDGRLVVIARRQGDVFWSDDGGASWTEPAVTPAQLFDPHLLLMPNGVLACFHGSYTEGKPGLRALLSPDGGQTWHGPGANYGYAVDESVYGYCHPMLLPDGTAYLVYQHTGGHHPADARTEALWALRVGVRDQADGIEILPAPGSPAALKRDTSGLGALQTFGGDPALGELC